jgi:hypothetical protein
VADFRLHHVRRRRPPHRRRSFGTVSPLLAFKELHLHQRNERLLAFDQTDSGIGALGSALRSRASRPFGLGRGISRALPAQQGSVTAAGDRVVEGVIADRPKQGLPVDPETMRRAPDNNRRPGFRLPGLSLTPRSRSSSKPSTGCWRIAPTRW